MSLSEEVKRRMRERWREREHGVSQADFERMLFWQNGRCAICGDEFKSNRMTHVDHNHNTGKVRDLLCHHCNAGLGLFKDSVLRLQQAIDYLRRHQEE